MNPFDDIDIEKSLLGCVLTHGGMTVLEDILSEDDFLSLRNIATYRAMMDLHRSGAAPEVVAVYHAIVGKDENTLDHLRSCVEQACTPACLPHFAEEISTRRRDARIRDTMESAVQGGDLDTAIGNLVELQQASAGPAGEPIARHLEEYDPTAPEVGHFTGFVDLDYLLRLRPTEVTIVAARPSIGKTAFAMNIVEYLAARLREPVPVGVFSLEMSAKTLCHRMIASRSGVNSGLLQGDRLMGRNVDAVATAVRELMDLPIYIDDRPGLLTRHIRASARRMMRQHNVGLIVIDYLQLIASDIPTASRYEQVTKISQEIKGMAKDLEVPVLLVAQLNRASENRQSFKPRSSDLRDSGQIEQDADIILLLHREDFYHQTADGFDEDLPPDMIGVAEVVISKQRNGPRGVVKLRFDNKTTRFKNHTEALP